MREKKNKSLFYDDQKACIKKHTLQSRCATHKVCIHTTRDNNIGETRIYGDETVTFAIYLFYLFIYLFFFFWCGLCILMFKYGCGCNY